MNTLKLTEADLDAAIWFRRPRPPLTVLRMRDGPDERIIVTAPGALDELPPLEIPLPFNVGATFKEPPPERDEPFEESDSDFRSAVYAWSLVASLLAGFLLNRCVGS